VVLAPLLPEFLREFSLEARAGDMPDLIRQARVILKSRSFGSVLAI
jgi:hypothetical protein